MNKLFSMNKFVCNTGFLSCAPERLKYTFENCKKKKKIFKFVLLITANKNWDILITQNVLINIHVETLIYHGQTDVQLFRQKYEIMNYVPVSLSKHDEDILMKVEIM